MLLGEMTWTQVREAIEAGATAIVPLGSIEEHGPHSPMGDYMVTEEIAAQSARVTNDVVVPMMPFGYSEYFRNFPGTITLRDSTLDAVLTDELECLRRHRFNRIVIFNGHSGNNPVVELVTRWFRREYGILIPSLSPFAPMMVPEVVEKVYGDKVTLGHGGEPMGSLMMHLRPGKVDIERAGQWGRQEVFGVPTEGLGTIRVGSLRVAVPLDMEDIAPPTGSLSDPTLASTERGQSLFETALAACIEFLKWFRSVDPYLETAGARART